MRIQVEIFADENSAENHGSQKKADVTVLHREYIFNATTTFWEKIFLGNNGEEDGKMERKTFWKFYQSY